MRLLFLTLIVICLSYGFANATCCPVDSCYDRSDSVWTDSCCVLIGDVNNSGSVNGLDVVYLQNWLRGSTAAPIPEVYCSYPTSSPYYMSADVNGSCMVNGMDLSYLVLCLQGQATPLCCDNYQGCKAYYP